MRSFDELMNMSMYVCVYICGETNSSNELMNIYLCIYVQICLWSFKCFSSDALYLFYYAWVQSLGKVTLLQLSGL